MSDFQDFREGAEVQICSNCIVDSGFVAFGTVTHSEEPLACDVCGGEFWTLNIAELDGVDPMQAEYQKALRYAAFPLVLNYGGGS